MFSYTVQSIDIQEEADQQKILDSSALCGLFEGAPYKTTDVWPLIPIFQAIQIRRGRLAG